MGSIMDLLALGHSIGMLAGPLLGGRCLTFSISEPYFSPEPLSWLWVQSCSGGTVKYESFIR